MNVLSAAFVQYPVIKNWGSLIKANMNIAYIWPQQLIERNRARYQRFLHISDSHNTIIFIRGDKEVKEEITNAAHTVVRTKHSENKYIEYIIYYITVLWWLFRKRLTGQIDSVHTFPGPSSLIGIVAKYFLGISWAADILDDPAVEIDAMEGYRPVVKYVGYRIHVFILRRALRFADIVFVIGWDISVGLPRKIASEYNIPKEKIVPIPNGVDLTETKPKGIPSDPHKMKVVYLGSIQAIRGIDILIKAVARTVEEVPEIELHLIGHTRTKKDKEEIEAKIESEGVKEHVKFTGNRVPHNEALEEIESADVCVLPLTNSVENYDFTLPIKLFEYLALGRPTIASDLVGVRQVISNLENGILVPPDDPKALSKALITLANNEELRQTIAENARDSIKKYDWPRIHQEVLISYREKI